MSASIDSMKESLDPKKRKIDAKDEANGESFAGFTIKKILREDQRSKFICLVGEFEGNDDSALVMLEKEHFPKLSLPRLLSKETTLKQTLKNDIYTTYEAYPAADLAGFKSTVIYPASQKHIDKYSDHDPFIIRETPQLYTDVTLPCLEKSNFSIKWVYNILEKKSESERIVFEDPDPQTGFLLVPDMKWDRKDIDSLYLVAIAHQHGLKSLRDLNKTHLPLLKNILDKGMTAICDKYSIPRHHLRVYVHYPPSYYHLHVHFTHLRYDAPGTDVLRAHLLSDVIDNMEAYNGYYQKKTMTFSIRENQDLYKSYQQAGYFT